jgi:hypothetical protein
VGAWTTLEEDNIFILRAGVKNGLAVCLTLQFVSFYNKIIFVAGKKIYVVREI